MSTSPEAGPVTSPAAGPWPAGTVIDKRFTLVEPRAQVAAITVYRARDNQAGDPAAQVSVSLIPLAALGARRPALESDLQKAQHAPVTNLARVLAYGEHADHIFVASEQVDGHPLRRAIDARSAKGERIGGKTAYTLLGHVAAGLRDAYRVMAHGALNPATVIVGRDGRVLVDGWGFFRGLPELGLAGGGDDMPAGLYLAPELTQGGPPTAQADVYSMGAMLYEMLTGAPPIPPCKPPSQVAPEVPAAVDAVVQKALARSPLMRQGTPQVLLAELAAALSLPSPGGQSAALPQRLPGPPGGALPGPALNPGQSSPGLGPARVTGRTFNVAEAAGLDSDGERWLVQKGKLDFGPFSMAQLKAEIGRGSFGADHTLVDTSSGTRTKLGKHPQMAEYVKGAERSLEAARRASAEQSLQSSEKTKGRFMFFVVGISVLVIGAGFGLYLMGREEGGDDALAERVGEADVDAFLKGVKLAFNQPRKPQRDGKRRAATAGGARGGDEFDDTQRLGDVSQGGGDAVLSEGAIQSTMMAHYRKLVPCLMQAKERTLDLDFVITGAGRVSAVKVNGQTSGPFPACVAARMKSFTFPKFDGNKTIASWSMSVR